MSYASNRNSCLYAEIPPKPHVGEIGRTRACAWHAKGACLVRVGSVSVKNLRSKTEPFLIPYVGRGLGVPRSSGGSDASPSGRPRQTRQQGDRNHHDPGVSMLAGPKLGVPLARSKRWPASMQLRPFVLSPLGSSKLRPEHVGCPTIDNLAVLHDAFRLSIPTQHLAGVFWIKSRRPF